MEINTVPRFEAQDAKGTTYSKIPRLQFPVDAEGRAYLVQDVTYYSKAAPYDSFKVWRDGGSACSGRSRSESIRQLNRGGESSADSPLEPELEKIDRDKFKNLIIAKEGRFF